MATRGLGSLTIDFIAKTGGFEQGMSKAERAAKRGTDSISRHSKKAADDFSSMWEFAVKRATAALGLLGAAFTFDKTVRTITGFQDSLLKLQATSRATAGEMSQLETQARSLGATTRYSAGQAADAQNFLAMAGFSTAEILQSTGDIINFASAASLDLAKSADIASNVLGQMGLPVSELTRAMDVMINTTQSANTDVAQLAEAFANVGPIATAAGISVEELAAAVGVLGDAGVQGGRAGTALTGIVAALSQETDKTTAVLRKYGMTMSDISLETNTLSEAMGKLAAMGVEESIEIFGRGAASAALSLAVAADSARDLTAANEAAAGSTKEVANLLDSGLSAAFAAITSAIEEMMLQVGENGLGGSMQLLAATVAGLINSFNGLLPEFAEASGLSKEFVANIELLTTAIKVVGTLAVSVFGGRLLSALGASAIAFASTTAQAIAHQVAMARLGAAIAGTSATMATATGAALGLGRAMTPLLAATGGIPGLVIGLGLAAAAFIGFSSKTKEASFDLSKLGDSIDEAIEKFKDLEKAAQLAAMSALGTSIRENEKEIKKLTRTAFEMTQFLSDMGDEADVLYNAFRQASLGMSVDWNALAETVQKSTTMTNEGKEAMLGYIAEAQSLTAEVDRQTQTYYALNDQLQESANLTDDAARAEATAQLAKDLATKSTQEFITKLDEEIQKMEDSIKTTRELAKEYIVLHGLQGGNVDLIMDAVGRWEKANESVKKHRKALSESSRAGRSSADATKKQAEELQKLIDTLNPAMKAEKDFAKQKQTLESALKSGKIATDLYEKSIAELNKRYEESSKQYLPDAIKKIDEVIKSTQEANKALKQQIAQYGFSASGIANLSKYESQYRIITLESTKAQLLSVGASEEKVKAIDEEIKKLNELIQVQGETILLEAAKEGQANYEEMTNEIKQLNAEIGDTLTDALMRGFEDGKGFAQNMKDTILNMFKTMVLRPMLQPVMQGIAGTITEVLGLGGQKGQSGGIGNIFSDFGGSIGKIAGNAGKWLQGFDGTLGSIGKSITDNIGSIGKFADAAGAAFSYGTGALDIFKGNYGAGIGAIGGQFLGGPVGSMIGKSLGSMLDKAFSGEERGGGGFGYNAGDASAYFGGGPSGGYGGQKTIDAMTQILKGQTDLIQSVLTGVGSSAYVGHVAGAFESSGKGRGGTYSGGIINIDGSEVKFGTDTKGQGYGGKSGSVEEMFANMEKDLAFSALEAFQAVGDQMPSIISDMINDLNVRALSAEQAGSIVAQVNEIVSSVNVLTAALNALPFDTLKGLTFDLTASLLEAAGGFDALMGGLNSYYQGFYDEQERFDLQAKQLQESIAALGLELPDTRAGFRALVDSLDAAETSSHAAIAGLLGLSGAADEFYSFVEAQADAAIRAAQEAAKEQERIAKDAAQEAERIANDAARSAQQAADNLRRSAQDMANTFAGISASIQNSIGNLYERITLDLMSTDEERYNYYKRQFDDLGKSLNFAESAEEVKDIIAQMTSVAGTAYGLLGEDVRKEGVGAQYKTELERLQAFADIKTEEIKAQQIKDRAAENEVSAERMAAVIDGYLSSTASKLDKSAENIGAWAADNRSALTAVAYALEQLAGREITL